MGLYFVKCWGDIRSVFDKEELAYKEICNEILSCEDELATTELFKLYETKQYKRAYEIGVQFHETFEVEHFDQNLNESNFVQED